MTSVPLTIRTAVADDVDALLDLIHAAYRGHGGQNGWTTEAELIDGPRTTRELLATDLADPAITVLVAGGHDGCAAVTHRAGEPTASFGMFAVRPHTQGAGVGKALQAAAEEHARTAGATTMELCVIDRRAELIAWYERRGYVRTGESRPFPYGEPGVGFPHDPDLRFTVLAKPLG
ncbi:GNAT family N-acetyltransferase [Actinomycetospora endophytica]|uniref:GNAT family N-acetyltransferase n=1 Tax=Actinomycetospora endophytica TaxID=2291215 RepID=A0ABS8PF42_9PSEU|nr:GNAT family N-acetyltransferase [Actinomycetospora endophytica]MCD2196872.1 GNAT family N-acetyltransferase [Actinomycetospora endophytica]